MTRATARWLCVLATLAFTATAAALTTGARAPEIGANDLEGHRVSIAGLRDRVVVVDFWATWCHPCADEMPVLQRWHAAMHEQGLTIVAVTTDRERAAVDRFVSQHHLTFPIVQEPSGTIAQRYAPPRQPTSYFVDRRGIVQHIHEGFDARNVARMEAELRALLAEP